MVLICSLEYDYAIYVRESQEIAYDNCEEAFADGAATGAYLLSTGQWVYCENDLSGGGWTLALNIDTSDGNVVDYQNTGFWESTTGWIVLTNQPPAWALRHSQAFLFFVHITGCSCIVIECWVGLGGARDYAVNPFEHDYKNPTVFSTFEANEIMIVLHVEGKEVLGYRAWQLYVPGQPLADYFTDTNACGTDDSAATLLSGGFSYVTSSVVDSWVGDDVIAEEPMIYNDGYQVVKNCYFCCPACFVHVAGAAADEDLKTDFGGLL